jgi:hypothetical protein
VHDVALQVAMVKDTIPTYVIGVGLDPTALQEIATAGGTGTPVMTSVGNPAQTQTDIQNALAQIRGLQVPCSFPLPSPPAGQVLDVDTVNVLYTPSVGQQTALTYDKSCPNGMGWSYDDVNNPTKVILCPQTCNLVQIDKGAQIDIVFGCKTLGNVL